MNTQNDLKENIYKKLSKIRYILSKTKIKKTGKAKYFVKDRAIDFDYFELNDFLPLANRLMAEHGICSACSIDTDKNEVNLTLTNCDAPEEKIVFRMPAAIDLITQQSQEGVKIPKAKIQLMQEYGAIYTYARRHLYLAAFEIVEGLGMIENSTAIQHNNNNYKNQLTNNSRVSYNATRSV